LFILETAQIFLEKIL